MTLLAILLLAAAAVCVVFNELQARRACAHTSTRGVANYYDRDRKVFVQLLQCEDCGDVLITTGE